MNAHGSTLSAAPRDGHGAPAAAVLSPTELNRLRWRCRRGMLENDLILERFLAARGATLTPALVVGLDQLLALTDTELWDLLAGRVEPEDATLAPIVDALRAA